MAVTGVLGGCGLLGLIALLAAKLSAFGNCASSVFRCFQSCVTTIAEAVGIVSEIRAMREGGREEDLERVDGEGGSDMEEGREENTEVVDVGGGYEMEERREENTDVIQMEEGSDMATCCEVTETSQSSGAASTTCHDIGATVRLAPENAASLSDIA